jgi:predicted nuclease of predicted toxin-antitoxin system
MRFWLDAQLPPSLATCLSVTFAVDATALRELGLRDAADIEIFEAARHEGIVIVTKDRDFVELVQRKGMPPQILWLTCGNLTNAHLRQLFERTFSEALELFEEGESIVELGD